MRANTQRLNRLVLLAPPQELLLLKQKRDGAGGTDSRAAEAAGDLAAAAADEDAWESVGRKNKTAVTRAHQTLSGDKESPITSLFGGVQGSIVTRRGAKPSKTLEPFKHISLVRACSPVPGLMLLTRQCDRRR